MGQFVLTGSDQFDLIAGMSQSLAGRVELLPLSLAEMRGAPASPQRSTGCC
jgi:predicted AAA+ superfamily ATPase